jgi:hypothetical protein
VDRRVHRDRDRSTAYAIGTSGGSISSDVRAIDRPELIWGHCLTGAFVNASAGAGFVTRLLMFGDILEDETALSAGTYAATCTLDSSSEWLALMVTLE